MRALVLRYTLWSVLEIFTLWKKIIALWTTITQLYRTKSTIYYFFTTEPVPQNAIKPTAIDRALFIFDINTQTLSSLKSSNNIQSNLKWLASEIVTNDGEKIPIDIKNINFIKNNTQPSLITVGHLFACLRLLGQCDYMEPTVQLHILTEDADEKILTINDNIDEYL